MGFPKSIRTIEIEQQCKYGFDLDYVKKFVDWSSIKDYAYILHDKDVQEDGTPKEPHIHLMLRFNQPVPTENLLKKLDPVCKIEHLEKMKSWNGAMAYLCHENRPSKYQYDHKEVYSNFDWEKDAEQGLKNANRLNIILAKIDNGDIKPYNIADNVDIEEYTKYKRQIDNAFEYRINKIKRLEREMDCIFITGDSGVGKTTYAKQIARDRGYKDNQIYVSSGSNDVLDDYKGQEVILLDDLRPSCLSLSDLLKMLDNNTASSVKSRFKNKVLECKLIIITSTLDIENFFSQVFENENETKIQLIRRCPVYIVMTKENIEYNVYIPKYRKYQRMSIMKNVVLEQYKVNDMTEDEKLTLLANILGGGAELFENLKKGVENKDFVPIRESDDIPF